ncbi:MAG TPA: hypothetical protein VNW97_23025 [Candidatus Saccharimonadales bacterium]|nr:hypothetical protein [Candidatus Saccharimonadales bacterium]
MTNKKIVLQFVLLAVLLMTANSTTLLADSVGFRNVHQRPLIMAAPVADSTSPLAEGGPRCIPGQPCKIDFPLPGTNAAVLFAEGGPRCIPGQPCKIDSPYPQLSA